MVCLNSWFESLFISLCLKLPGFIDSGSDRYYLFYSILFFVLICKVIDIGDNFIPWLHLVSIVYSLHFIWRNFSTTYPAEAELLLYLELSKSEASAQLINSCFYSISGKQRSLFVFKPSSTFWFSSLIFYQSLLCI